MLAAEVLQFAIRTMWDEAAGSFRDRVAADDPVVPFELNCHAACVLDRLGVLTGDAAYQDRARAILQSLAPDVSRSTISLVRRTRLPCVRSSIGVRRRGSS